MIADKTGWYKKRYEDDEPFEYIGDSFDMVRELDRDGELYSLVRDVVENNHDMEDFISSAFYDGAVYMDAQDMIDEFLEENGEQAMELGDYWMVYFDAGDEMEVP